MEIKYINRANGEIIIENPPAEGLMKFLYNNLVGEKLILPIAKQKFITDFYGKMMDSPSSTNRIQPFVASLNIDMSQFERGINEFTSFNDFFYRKLKENVRKIEDGLVSPGDGRMLAFKKISEVNSFYVKGRKFTLKEFLKDDKLVEKYKDASMFILRLAPEDYHRYHFPFKGTPSKSKEIKGMYYSVSPIGLRDNFTKVFCENKKETCELKTENKGEILIIPVGATMVGSLNSTYEPNKMIEKGEEMGYFAFGGSTVVLLFDSAHFKIDEDLVQNTQNNLETFVKMGEKIASEI
ncbi:MAG: phosphatidylserine decarboxylase [Flexibacter sp. CG_4_10_14_3_um_filter_32_15]|nr:MAG: phosphatidylserine decarboxylase [Flexibacter sp. CG_4_10_14_3_um_filter_32_15]